MHNLIKLIFTVIVIGSVVSSCQKEDTNNNDWLKEQQRLDSLNRVRIEKTLIEQAPLLKDFAENNMPDAELDDSTGIWYKIHDAGIEDSFDYRIISTPSGLAVSPQYTEVKYTGTLIKTGGEFEKTAEDETAIFPIGSLIPAWYMAFWPKSLEYNLRDYVLGGFTTKGLKTGAIIEIAAPSPYCYDNVEQKNKDGEITIPADSPLHFYIEVVDIRETE